VFFVNFDFSHIIQQLFKRETNLPFAGSFSKSFCRDKRDVRATSLSRDFTRFPFPFFRVKNANLLLTKG